MSKRSFTIQIQILTDKKTLCLDWQPLFQSWQHFLFLVINEIMVYLIINGILNSM